MKPVSLPFRFRQFQLAGDDADAFELSLPINALSNVLRVLGDTAAVQLRYRWSS